MEEEKVKQCSYCKEVKPLSSFKRRGKRGFIICARCNDCYQAEFQSLHNTIERLDSVVEHTRPKRKPVWLVVYRS